MFADGESCVTDFGKVDANLQACFRALAIGRENAEIRSFGGIHILSLGVRFQMFNAAYLASPVRDENDFELRTAAAAVHFGARGVEWSLWLCDSLLPETVNRRAQRILLRQGLTLATQMPGMIATELLPATRPLPECEMRAVDSTLVLSDFRIVGSRCFQVPQAWFDEVFDGGTLERIPFRAWVGYVDGRPIATAATVAVEGVLGIYNVATLPDFRGAGYAEAIMRACVAEENARYGEMPLVLQSTASGLALYKRLGFIPATHFRVWVS